MAEHDYNVANASGSTVRTDINNALAAIVSLNSKATAPTTTFAHMLWMDTAPSGYSQCKVRNAGDSAWGMLFDDEGRIKTEDGTVSEPSHAFGNDVDTGAYLIATGRYGIATGGVNAIEVSASQQVGIGGAPTKDLHLHVPTSGAMEIASAAASTVAYNLLSTSTTWKIQNKSGGGQFAIRENSTDAITIETSTQEIKNVGPFTLTNDFTAGTGGVNKTWAGLYGVNDMVLDNVSPPATSTFAYSVGMPSFDSMNFSTGVDEIAHIITPMPSDYDGSNIIVDVMWTGTVASANTVRWLAAGRCFDDGDGLAAAYPATTAADDALGLLNQLQITSITITPTTSTNNDLLAIEITREGTHVNDNYANDARLMRVRVRYA